VTAKSVETAEEDTPKSNVAGRVTENIALLLGPGVLKVSDLIRLTCI
jgi:hypothetical protein